MTKVYFGHGLGDCVHFAHQLPLYARRGHQITVACDPDKQILFQPCGVTVTRDKSGAQAVPWHEGTQPGPQLRWNNYWQCSKMGRNLSVPPLPDIGPLEELWEEFCGVSLDLRPYLATEAEDLVRTYVDKLPKPLILLHTHGNNCSGRKNVPKDLCVDLYKRLLDVMDGTLLLLDWDQRVPRLPHWRIRHLTDDWQKLNTEQLLVLIDCADLLIGIDSGPLHAARFTDTRTIGLWMNGGSPVTWSLPRALQVNMVVGGDSQVWSKHARIPFNIVECPDHAAVVPEMGKLCRKMLSPPRYLGQDRLAADVQLQHFVLDRLRGDCTALAGFGDRHKSIDLLLRVMSARFSRARVVETGCIRREVDFQGAGFSTYILGAYLNRRGGHLSSVDNNASHCTFARDWTECFGDTVSVVTSDSVEWLSRNREPINVLYLESLDTDFAGAADHALREIQAAYQQLQETSLVVCDDTAYFQKHFRGKGAQAIPWLLERGWEILYSGHPCVLSRTTTKSFEPQRCES